MNDPISDRPRVGPYLLRAATDAPADAPADALTERVRALVADAQNAVWNGIEVSEAERDIITRRIIGLFVGRDVAKLEEEVRHLTALLEEARARRTECHNRHMALEQKGR